MLKREHHFPISKLSFRSQNGIFLTHPLQPYPHPLQPHPRPLFPVNPHFLSQVFIITNKFLATNTLLPDGLFSEYPFLLVFYSFILVVFSNVRRTLSYTFNLTVLCLGDPSATPRAPLAPWLFVSLRLRAWKLS